MGQTIQVVARVQSYHDQKRWASKTAAVRQMRMVMNDLQWLWVTNANQL